MASSALRALFAALPEAEALLRAEKPLRPLGQSEVGSAIRRASTVALSSFYERYLYQVNEEAVDAINAASVSGNVLPVQLRLVHTKSSVDSLSQTRWDGERRVLALERFVREEAWLWTSSASGMLEHGRLLEFMSAPKPKEVSRYFRYWDIPDIFSAITRKPHVRTKLYVTLVDLVDKRNAIAHGDPEVVPTYRDVIGYRSVVKLFCERVDRTIARRIAELTAANRPW